MREPGPLYHVTLYITEDKRHSSFVVKGLLELEKKSYIELKLKTLPIYIYNRYVLGQGKFTFKKKGYPWCLELVVSEIKKRKSIRIGIDLQDWIDQFSFHSFQKCDLIYKRALTATSLNEINKIRKNFVIPFGPNCRAIVTDNRFKRINKKIYLRNLLIKAFLNPINAINKIMKYSYRIPIKQISAGRDGFLKNPPQKKYIFFQVQYYNWNSHHSKVLNDFRANIIRRLKMAFKEQFYGGMWFQGKIDKKYADCISNVDTEFEIYSSFMKNASIVISTNGFGDSIPWKIVEYMRNGSCIVSQKNKHLFREPIDKDIIANFETPDECIDICKKLLKDNLTISRMAQQSRLYYENHLKPSSVMKQILNESVSLL